MDDKSVSQIQHEKVYIENEIHAKQKDVLTGMQVNQVTRSLSVMQTVVQETILRTQAVANKVN